MIFAGARRAAHASAAASATNSAGSSASARVLGGAADRRERRRGALPRRPAPASASEFGSVFRRCANAASTTRLDPRRSRSGSGTRRNATSAESTFGGGRKTVRETGWKPVRARSELDEHRDGAVRLRRRLGEEAVGDLALHHHAPELEARAARRGSRRRSASRRCRAGSRRASSAAGRARRGRARARRRSAASTFGAPPSARAGAARASGRARRRGRARRGRRGSASGRRGRARSRARRRPAPSSASRPITPRMFSSARKCWPSAFFGATVTAARRRRPRWRRSAPRARPASSPRAAASAATVWTTFAGSFGRPRSGCGARYGLSVSARSRSAGTARGRLAQLGGLRVGDVAGERDVVAALERGRSRPRRREAVQDDRAVEARASVAARVVVRRARVDRRPACRARRRARAAPRRGAAARPCVARSRGGSRGRSRRRRPRAGARAARAARRRRVASAVAAWCGSMPSAATTPSCSLGDRERRAARLDPGPDRDDARHAGLARARDERVARLLARVEVRVGVDHAAASARRSRGKSGAAASMPVGAPVRPVARRSSQASVGRLAERREDRGRPSRAGTRPARRRRRAARRRGRRATRSSSSARSRRPSRAATAPRSST